MNIKNQLIRLVLPLVTILSFSLVTTAAQAAIYGGNAVSAGGVTDASVGLPPVPVPDGTIEYFIPLASTHTGTYGDTAPPNPCTNGIGTCSDYGSGQGYDTANALMMNIFFDTGAVAAGVGTTLDIHFDDLDLAPVNDPTGFLESLSFSYWDSSSFQSIGGVIQHSDQLTDGDFLGAATTSNPLSDPFTWSLDLDSLGILDQVANGFWIQLGFGSEYRYTYGDKKGLLRNGQNTHEFLSASLNVSPIPVPAAFWLFGTALIGFIGMSRRTRI